MQANEAITKIKLLLGLNEETVEETVVVEASKETTEEVVEGPKDAFAMATLADGTEVKVEGEFEEGKACFVETEEGDIPAPAGKHQMADDTLITIDESGKIVAIEEVAAEEVTDAVEEVEMEEDKKEEEAMEEEVEVSMAEEVVEMLKPYFEEISDLKKKVEEMEGKFQAFSAEPAAKPIKKAENFEANKLSAVERIASIRRSK